MSEDKLELVREGLRLGASGGLVPRRCELGHDTALLIGTDTATARRAQGLAPLALQLRREGVMGERAWWVRTEKEKEERN